MQRFQSGTFTFDAPTSWDEVSLGQFLALQQADDDVSHIFVIATLVGVNVDEFMKLRAPLNAGKFMLDRMDFLKQKPVVSGQLPSCITIDGTTYPLPKDLGATATFGQMCDVDLAIRAREKKNLSVDPVSMADQLLPVFLWSLLKSEPYQSRSQAAQLLPLISTIPCIEALAVSAFFLRNSLRPTDTGRISVVQLPLTRWKKWRKSLLRVWKRLTCTLQASTLPKYSGSITPTHREH